MDWGGEAPGVDYGLGGEEELAFLNERKGLGGI